MTGSAPAFSASKDSKIFDVTPAILTGRKYLAIRAIHGEEGETTLAAQKRIAEEVYNCVDDNVTVD